MMGQILIAELFINDTYFYFVNLQIFAICNKKKSAINCIYFTLIRFINQFFNTTVKKII